MNWSDGWAYRVGADASLRWARLVLRWGADDVPLELEIFLDRLRPYPWERLH